ncbi:hypothetical protein E5K52_03090 [Helicobacter pylori]|nr:hypothetical protein E5K52_03090 [Helicobacter pylori]
MMVLFSVVLLKINQSLLKRAKSVTDRYALIASNDFKKHSKLSKINKAKALNKKDPKREMGF